MTLYCDGVLRDPGSCPSSTSLRCCVSSEDFGKVDSSQLLVIQTGQSGTTTGVVNEDDEIDEAAASIGPGKNGIKTQKPVSNGANPLLLEQKVTKPNNRA
jgi:hypothetical protein